MSAMAGPSRAVSIVLEQLCFAHKQARSERGHGTSTASVPVFDGLSLRLEAGSTLAVIGPSGCGKSTLLSLLAGLSHADSGLIRLGDAEDRHGGKPVISFILQDYGLFPWKRVRENLSLPLRLAGVPRVQCAAAVAAIVDELGLTGLEDRYPARLSGGQAQRVAIGRALVTQPSILLMDEPFSSLDALTREYLQATVLTLWQRHRPSCVLVTHDVDEALLLGQSILVLGTQARNSAAACEGGLWLENPYFGLTHDSEQQSACSATRAELVRQIRKALAGGL